MKIRPNDAAETNSPLLNINPTAVGPESGYRLLLESMEQGFCLLEMLFDDAGNPSDYRFIDMNSAFSRHTGLVNAIGKTARELVPDLDPYWFETYGRVALTGEPIHFENEAPAMHRWFDVYASRLGDADSRKVVLFFNDITSRKLVETEREQLLKQLTVASNRLTDVFKNAPSYMCVLRGPKHVFEMSNERYRQLIGNRDHIGRPIREALPEVEGQGFFELLDQVYHTGETFTSNDMRLLLQQHPDGPPEVRYFDFIYMPLRDANGDVTGIVAQGVDLTDRKIAEERLRLLDAVSMATRDALDPQTVMVATTRLLGEYLSVARCAYADLQPDNDRFTIRHDWTANGVPTTVGTYSLDLFGTRAASAMRNGNVLVIRNVDRELSRSDGADTFNAIGVKAIICCPLVKGDQLVAMMAVHNVAPRDWSSEDVALVQEVAERSWAHVERVRSMEALREADQRKTEFLAALAHELRNPLAPIQTGLDILRIAAADQAALEKTRSMMERQLRHLVHLVDDLLDVARISRGKIELRKENVELRHIVTSAIEASLPFIEAGRHDFSVRIPDDPVLLNVDPTRISQVISNLLNNAAKYTPAGGKVSLTAQQNAQEVEITVKDTGVGIPQSRLSDVFEMFSQVGESTGRAQGGLGIGLTIVSTLVQLHGGTITVASDGPGKGSDFIVRLPIHIEDTPSQSLMSDSAPDRPTETTHHKILVIDDNEDAAETLSTLLSMDGYETRVVNDGRTALEMAATFMPSIIFLDIGMPGMNGYEIIAALRQMDAAKNAVIVAVTGWGTESDRQQTRQAGFDYHLTKPASYEDVQGLILQATSQR
jgi:signal transduction histidine kinase/PAS domain-containing protein/ActR/RegA family two-component response regulator